MKIRFSLRTIFALVTVTSICVMAPYWAPKSRTLVGNERYRGYFRGLGWTEGAGYFGTHWYRVVVNEDPEGYWEVDINGQDYAPYRGYYPNGVRREKGTCSVEKIGDEIVPDRTDVLDAEYFDPNGRAISRVKNGTGKQILYSTNGSPFWELHLEDRKRTLLRMWQHPNGQLSYESKGQDHGEFAAYYSDGQVMYHGEFENGKRTTKTDYTPNGQVKKLTTYDEHGTVESVTEYDQHGNVIGTTE